MHVRHCDCEECLPGFPAEQMSVTWRRQYHGVFGNSLRPHKPLWFRALKKRGSLGEAKEVKRSQYAVARALGISRARVKQLEHSALRKLREALEADP